MYSVFVSGQAVFTGNYSQCERYVQKYHLYNYWIGIAPTNQKPDLEPGADFDVGGDWRGGDWGGDDVGGDFGGGGDFGDGGE